MGNTITNKKEYLTIYRFVFLGKPDVGNNLRSMDTLDAKVSSYWDITVRRASLGGLTS